MIKGHIKCKVKALYFTCLKALLFQIDRKLWLYLIWPLTFLVCWSSRGVHLVKTGPDQNRNELNRKIKNYGTKNRSDIIWFSPKLNYELNPIQTWGLYITSFQTWKNNLFYKKWVRFRFRFRFRTVLDQTKYSRFRSGLECSLFSFLGLDQFCTPLGAMIWKWYKEISTMFLLTVDGPVWLIMKVVDLINNSPIDARPSVLVSATAVGYYGMCLMELSVCILSRKKVVLHSWYHPIIHACREWSFSLAFLMNCYTIY